MAVTIPTQQESPDYTTYPTYLQTNTNHASDSLYVCYFFFKKLLNQFVWDFVYALDQ